MYSNLVININLKYTKGEINMSWMFAGFQLLNVGVMLAFLGLSVYVLILFIQFLKVGTKAFQKYLNSDKDEL